MAAGRKGPELRQASLSIDQISAAISKIDRRIADIDSFDLNAVRDRSDPQILALSSKLDELLLSIFGANTIEYEKYRWPVTELDTASINYAHSTPLHEVIDGLRRGLARAKTQLETIKSLFLEAVEDGQVSATDAPRELFGLHERIHRKCGVLFEAGMYVQSVELSFKIVRDRLRELTGHETASEAFGKGHLHIRGAAAANVDADFNQGAKFLMMAIDMFRNEKSHTSDANIDDLALAYRYLMLSSLALDFLGRAEVRAKSNS